MPKLSGFDHIHVYVPSREESAEWFRSVLGFHIVDKLRFWAAGGGPLTIADDSGAIHLALFAKENPAPSTAIAFGADAENFLRWKEKLEGLNILTRCTDHKAAWSLYFTDPYGNSYEITNYEYDRISAALAP